MTSALELLIQYLAQGDLFGFLQAIYTASFLGYSELFYTLLSMLFVIPTYIRTKSLLFMSLLWMLFGTLFLIAMPMVSIVAILMVIFGIGGLLFKVYLGLKS